MTFGPLVLYFSVDYSSLLYLYMMYLFSVISMIMKQTQLKIEITEFF